MILVGIDYDEPIYTWYDYAHKVSCDAGLADPNGDPPTEWDPTTTYGCTLDEWVEVLSAEVHKDYGMYHWPVKPEVVQGLRKMYNTGLYEIHIITARGQFGPNGDLIKRLTRSQIVREGIPYTSLTFTENKHAAIKRLGLHYFLDDRPNHWTAAQEAGAQAYLLDERWNQDFKVPRGRRVYSTNEYLDLIMRRHGECRIPLSPKQRSHVAGRVGW